VRRSRLCDRPRCPSATGGRTMYWASASRVLAQPAGMRIDASTLETTVSPLEHVLGQPLVQELALEEERDDSLAQAGAHLGQISSRDVDESALSVKASLQEQAVPMGIPASELS